MKPAGIGLGPGHRIRPQDGYVIAPRVGMDSRHQGQTSDRGDKGIPHGALDRFAFDRLPGHHEFLQHEGFRRFLHHLERQGGSGIVPGEDHHERCPGVKFSLAQELVFDI